MPLRRLAPLTLVSHCPRRRVPPGPITAHEPAGLATATLAQQSPRLAQDGSGGMFLVWRDAREAPARTTSTHSTYSPRAKSTRHGPRTGASSAMRPDSRTDRLVSPTEPAGWSSHGSTFTQRNLLRHLRGTTCSPPARSTPHGPPTVARSAPPRATNSDW